MSFQKSVTVAIFSLTGLTIYGIFNGEELLLSLGHILLLPMVGIWYGVKRQWALNSIDKIIYIAFLLGSLSDTIILIDWGQTGEFLQISVSLMMNLLLIIVFRKEGTRIYSNKMQDSPKIIVPSIIIFLFFGYFLMPSLPTGIYFVTILYAILEVLLITHGFFRLAKGQSYTWVAFGVSFVFFKDVIYCFHFFIYNNTKPYLYAIQYPMNVFAYFMIAIGVAYNQSNEGSVKNVSVWQFIKNHIKLIFSFNNLTHIQKNIPPISSNSFQQNLLPKTQTN